MDIKDTKDIDDIESYLVWYCCLSVGVCKRKDYCKIFAVLWELMFKGFGLCSSPFIKLIMEVFFWLDTFELRGRLIGDISLRLLIFAVVLRCRSVLVCPIC